MSAKPILTAVYTDGMGTFQARCLSCTYRGKWWRTEARALKDAKAHDHEEVAS